MKESNSILVVLKLSGEMKELRLQFDSTVGELLDFDQILPMVFRYLISPTSNNPRQPTRGLENEIDELLPYNIDGFDARSAVECLIEDIQNLLDEHLKLFLGENYLENFDLEPLYYNSISDRMFLNVSVGGTKNRLGSSRAIALMMPKENPI